MTLEQSVKFYENQTAALNVMERMAEQLEKILNITQKTAAAANKMKSPFDAIAKNIGTKIEGGFSNAKSMFDPRTFLKDPKKLLTEANFFLPLALNIGWQLFGDDIMTLLGPAMGVLESFAGLVHNALAALNPLFQPVVFGLEMISAGLGAMAQNAGLFLPAAAA